METIIGIIIGVASILGIIIATYKVIYRLNHKLDKIITLQPTMMSSLFACLDGLTQLGANGKVTEAKEELLKTLIKE